MRPVQVCSVLVASLLGLGLISPLNLWAKPRKIVSNGCTAEQIQSNFGSSCVGQMEQDLINNRSYTHVMFCNGDDRQCCTVDNATNQVVNCRKPAGSSALALQGTAIAPSKLGGIQTRGVEGADATDEETPAPKWITEERMKQVKKDMQTK